MALMLFVTRVILICGAQLLWDFLQTSDPWKHRNTKASAGDFRVKGL
jgi:hypothetical protein